MKRTISIVLLLLCVLASSAQIQRKIMGFTLGVTTKTQVINSVKLKHLKYFKIDADNAVVVKNVSFGGYKWPIVGFTFYGNKLYRVAFINTEDDTPQSMLELIHKGLELSLDVKYKKYYKGYDPELSKKLYSDETVELTLTYGYGNLEKARLKLYLDYTYIPFTLHQFFQGQSEL